MSIADGKGKYDQLGLLDYLTESLGYEYLSDLRGNGCKAKVCAALKQIDEKEYTLPSWQDAACYITSQNVTFQTILEAKNWLIKYLQCTDENEI